MEIATLLLSILASPLLLVNLVFLNELVAGLPRGRPKGDHVKVGRTAIIIPAHNEAQGIGRSIEAMKSVVGPDFQILVVADNCVDETAAIARAMDVTVIERTDLHRRGKGHALAFARQWLRKAPPEAVIVLDADCRTDHASLRNLAGACLTKNQPAQAINLLEPDRSDPPMVQISTFAFLIKNLVRQRGLQRLTGGVHLTGTGMCLPWSLFEQADLATSNIVEDIRLGIEMARRGAPPQLVSESIVWSEHADIGDTITQRSRWEGGFLSTAGSAAPAMILRGLREMRARTILSGLDLLVPPLALLAIMNVAVLLLTGAAAAVGWSGILPTIILVIVGSLMCAALAVAWWREGRDYLSIAALVRLPFYALWKVPMYLRLLRSGSPSEWLRTTRPGGKDRGA